MNQTSATQNIAQEACSSISKHYSDPIHYASDPVNESPYLDQLSDETLPDLSPFCKVWYDRLLHANGGNYLDAACELLCCYSAVQAQIRQIIGCDCSDTANICGSTIVPSVGILYNYQLTLSHLLSDTSANNLDNGQPSERVQFIGKTINAIAQDIILWTTNLPSHPDELLKVQNDLLSHLLRLLEHSVTVLGKVEAYESSDKSLVKEAMAVVTVVAAPFVGDGTSNSSSFNIGSLFKWTTHDEESRRMSLAHTVQSSWLPESAVDEELISSEFMTRDVVDWLVPEARLQTSWVSVHLTLLFR